MVVQHNLTAMNSNRMLNLTVKGQAKSTEKLSSGYRINRAADDAAGLSISEKMRKQIRGLTQASANAQDGISCVQTAEGALNEVQDMLQRMNELAVKAANGTNSSDDRTYIQNEIDQLNLEIDRVAETTKFNETYLLKGDKNLPLENEMVFAPITDTTATVVTAGATAVAKTTSETYIYDGVQWLNSAGTKIADIDGEKLGIKSVTTPTKGDLIKYDGATKTFEYVDADPRFGLAIYDQNGNRIPHNALDSYFTFDETATPPTYKIGDKAVYLDEANNIELTQTIIDQMATDDVSFLALSQTKVPDLGLKLHVGADATSNNQITLKIESLSAHGIGIDNIRVDGNDDTNARYAIDTVKAAIQKISTQRSALGAIQNRLDHTINNLDNVVENTTSAEASIRDTDMATEMVRYSNNNILAQAGQAMLAQANQSNQGVLSLLQ